MRLLLLGLFAALFAALLLPLPAPANVAATTVLPPGEGLAPGDRLTTHRTRLVMQRDGDLVFSAQSRDRWQEVWASETSGNPGAYALMQEDGNLVVYSSSGEALWNAGTFDHPGAYLQLEDDGRRLVIYDADGIDLWVNGHPAGPPPSNPHGLDPGDGLGGSQSVSSPNGHAVLTMQDSGNVVLSSKGGLPRRRIWSSETAGNEGARLVMQEDGNLAIYAIGGVPVWNSGTAGNPGAYLRILDEGKAVLYSKEGGILWVNGFKRPGPAPKGDRLDANQELGSGQSMSSQGGNAVLTMRRDGNLVLSRRRGRRLQRVWSSRTSGNPGARLVMQEDGNLVIYDSGGSPLWSSGTAEHPGAFMRVLDTVAIAVFNAGGVLLWTSEKTDPPPPPPTRSSIRPRN